MLFHASENGVPFFRFETFPAQLSHGVLTRQGGAGSPPFDSLNLSSSVPDAAEDVEENRRRAYGQFKRSVDTLVHAHLVHHNQVAHVSATNHGEVMPAVDGLITAEPGCGLTMNFADCAPILVYDPEKQITALGHAGWKGTVADVPGALVRAMVEAYGCRPEQLLGAIGPCIGPEVYEVGGDVISAVEEAFPGEVDRLLIPQPNGPRPHFDLVEANKINFERAGLRSIESSGLSTGSRTDLFFSHRVEKGKTGRFGVVIINS